MGRKKSHSQELEQYARGRLRSVFSDWILNPREQEDFGFDYEVRLTEKKDDFFVVTPSNFFVQLKASEHFDDNESVYWDLDVDYLIEDCLPAPIPVVLMIFERESDEFYWSVIQTYCWDVLDGTNETWRNQKTARIRVDRMPLMEKLDSFEALASQSKFRRDITEAEDRISIRRHIRIVKPDDDKEPRSQHSRIASAGDVEKFKSRKLESARELLRAGAKSRALAELFEIYHMPERDEATLEAIVELIKARDIIHPIIAFAHDEFAQTGIELAKKVDEPDTLAFLRERKEISEEVIRNWVPGARVFDTRVNQEILVLGVEDWAHWDSDESMWMALLQYEDGDFWDETAAALMGDDRYEILELDENRHPYHEGCPEGGHEFPKNDLRRGNGPAFCENCGYSLHVVMSFLDHDPPFVCEICDSLKEFSEFNEGHICNSCRDSDAFASIE